MRVELPPGCGADGARLISVSGIDHGGVVLTAEGRMWVSFPWRDAKDAHPSRGDRDGKAEDPAGQLYRLATALHAANQPDLPAPKGPEIAARTETKAASARTGAGSLTVPGLVRLESSQVDADPPAGSKRPRLEASQVDASPLPSAKRSRRETASAPQGDAMDRSVDPDRPQGSLASQAPDLEPDDGPRDPGQVLRALLRDEVLVRGLMTFDQADTVEEWLNEQLPGLQPSSAERTSLAERTGLRTSYIGQLLEAVRGIMSAAKAGPGRSSPVSPMELNPAPPNGNPLDWQG